ncbi:MAG: transcriptional repressor LexA [Clostridia bacterium]|nr:transcriptional repressor LexA [Clostridia bacterium]
MNGRNEKINAVYEYIEKYTEDNGFPPSVREICRACGVKSTASVYDYIEELVKSGLLNKADSKKRAVSVRKKCEYRPSPVIGKITAGNPILAVENFDGYYPLPNEFGEDTFILNVSGSSMIGAGIFNGDRIIVRRQSVCDNGDIVVALTDDSATVKTFYKRGGKIILHPENPEMSDIVLDDVRILGKVIGLIRKF